MFFQITLSMTQLGSYPANEYGLYDMAGNVFEWCLDTYREQLIGNKNPIYAGSGCPYTSLSSCIIWVLRFLLNVDHRSNLIGMGILPLQFQGQDNIASLGLDGSETVSILGISDDLQPMQEATVSIARSDGTTQQIIATVRIDTPIEVEYYRHSGILDYVIRNLLPDPAN